MCENAVFVFFVKAQVARKRVILLKSFFHKSCFGKCWKLMAMFHLLNIRTSIGLFRNDKCKLAFGLKYISTLPLYDSLMTLKNTDLASAKLINVKFNILVLTIQDDLVGLYGYQKTTKKQKNKLAFTLSKKIYLAFKATEKITWFSGRKKDGLNPKYAVPPPPTKKARSLS